MPYGVMVTTLIVVGVFIIVSMFLLLTSYADHYSSSCIKMSFESWESLYLIAPHHWHLTKEACCYSKDFMKNYFVYFSLIDYIKYCIFLYQLDKKEYTMAATKEVQEFLKSMQEEIEQYKLSVAEEKISMLNSIREGTKKHNTYISIKHL